MQTDDATMKAHKIMSFIEKWQDHIVLLAIFPTCSLAGLASLLRSDRPITKRAVASVMLNSGFFGVVVAAFMIHQYEFSFLTIVASLLAGLGGNAMWESILELFLAVMRAKVGGNGKMRSHEEKGND